MFDRMMSLIRANLDHMLSKAEDPQKVLDLAILDMQGALVEAKKQVAVVIADERRLHKQAADAGRAASQWEQKAMLAVRSGAEDLARAALIRKKEHDELASMYSEQWQSQKNSSDALRSALVGLSQKLAEAHRTRRVLIARMRRAEAQRTINATIAGLNASGHNGASSAWKTASPRWRPRPMPRSSSVGTWSLRSRPNSGRLKPARWMTSWPSSSSALPSRRISPMRSRRPRGCPRIDPTRWRPQLR